MTVTHLVGTVKETIAVTQPLVNVLVDVNNIGRVSNVTVCKLFYNEICKNVHQNGYISELTA